MRIDIRPVEKSLSGLLEPDIKETVLDSAAEIQKIFKVSTCRKNSKEFKVLNGEIRSKSKSKSN